MQDILLSLRLIAALASVPSGELTPREAVRRVAMDYRDDYFPQHSRQSLRRLLDDEGEEWSDFLQRLRDLRMDLAYRGLVTYIYGGGRAEGRRRVSNAGRNWFESVWRGPSAVYDGLRLPPRQSNWREIADLPPPRNHLSPDPSVAVNLDQIDPDQFERLMGELLERMGWRPRVTRRSRDGGVDVDATNSEPITGGRILVQCKRTTSVVGVGTVRELYGVVVGERATKGVVVTTAWFSPDAVAFARDKPLELIDRHHLTTLLSRHGFQVDSSQRRAVKPQAAGNPQHDDKRSVLAPARLKRKAATLPSAAEPNVQTRYEQRRLKNLEDEQGGPRGVSDSR